MQTDRIIEAMRVQWCGVIPAGVCVCVCRAYEHKYGCAWPPIHECPQMIGNAQAFHTQFAIYCFTCILRARSSMYVCVCVSGYRRWYAFVANVCSFECSARSLYVSWRL